MYLGGKYTFNLLSQNEISKHLIITMFKFLLGILLIFTSVTSGFSQGTISEDPLNIFLISATYSFQVPEGDLLKRFGASHSVGPALYFKTKQNFFTGFEYNFIFGNVVKDDPLTELKAQKGYVINGSGEFEVINYLERGFLTQMKFGKIFNWVGPNINSGIVLAVGGGLIQHKIYFHENTGNVFQLSGDYKKGYDRLTNGFSLSESLGYLNLSNNRLINFMIFFEAVQGFTKCRRDWDFKTNSKLDENRLDLIYSVRVVWSFPIYKRAPEKYYFN